jgi:phosphoribosylformylglycinamidine cyclo-ligase
MASHAAVLQLERRDVFERNVVRALFGGALAGLLHLALAAAWPVSAFAHITGGGLTDNIPRVLPDGLEAHLVRSCWHRDPVFDWLATTGRITPAEMYRTFNCGIGMIAVVPAAHAGQALALLRAAGEQATVIGSIRAGNAGVVIDG